MSPWSVRLVRVRRLRVVAVLSVVVMLAGCTYADEEPGLLGRTPAPSSGPLPSATTSMSLPSTNPALPVLAEDVWTSADGLAVQVRIAVHAVRRIDRATVLDWSVTPLTVPNLQPGDGVPEGLDLGLSRPADELPRIFLLDSGGGHLYRPSLSAAGPPTCVCTPLSSAQRRLRVGHTTVLQVAFPALPESVSAIDVVFATLPPFGQLPITRADHVPVAAGPTQLGRSAVDGSDSGGFSEMFRFGPDEQVFRIRTNRVLAGSTFTALDWTIWSVTGGEGLDSASEPPFAEPAAAGEERADRVTASGPVLVVASPQGERALRARLSEEAGSDALECLCTPLQGWTSVLRRPDKPAGVVTTYPPLPAGTRRVLVRFVGLDVQSLAVTPAPEATSRIDGVRRSTGATWRSGDPQRARGWASEDWPTPVPSGDQLPETGAEPSALVR